MKNKKEKALTKRRLHNGDLKWSGKTRFDLTVQSLILNDEKQK